MTIIPRPRLDPTFLLPLSLIIMGAGRNFENASPTFQALQRMRKENDIEQKKVAGQIANPATY